MAEFDLIARYFSRHQTVADASVDLSIGDDAALLQVATGQQLVISADMSVCGTHFFADAAPYDIGWKSMAVNISDMAAMGAQPKWATLAIALPEADAGWLQGFSDGMFACADAYHVRLIGGDTTRGPLNIAINILGEVPIGQALRRDGAQAGDDVWVSGQLGAAALWLQARQGLLQLEASDLQRLAPYMHQPQPRVALGLALRGLAHSALDISDGLLADLGHILKASRLGAELDWAAMPKPQGLTTSVPESVLQQAVLAGGDDYELCFTVPPSRRAHIEALAHTLALPLTRIGHLTAEAGLQVMHAGKTVSFNQPGYQHFG